MSFLKFCFFLRLVYGMIHTTVPRYTWFLRLWSGPMSDPKAFSFMPQQLLAALAMGAHGAVGRSVSQLYELLLFNLSVSLVNWISTFLVIVFHFSAFSTFNYVGCHVSELVSAFEKGDLLHARMIQVQSISSYSGRPLLILNFGCWHLYLISSSSSSCKTFSGLPPDLVSDSCVAMFSNIVLIHKWSGTLCLSVPYGLCFSCYLQVLMWEWTNSWWSRCPGCVWAPRACRCCLVLKLVLWPSNRSAKAFFLNPDNQFVLVCSTCHSHRIITESAAAIFSFFPDAITKDRNKTRTVCPAAWYIII